MSNTTDPLDDILDDLDWGYTYKMSDYASSREQEKEYERKGKAEIKKVKAKLNQYIEERLREARVNTRVSERSWAYKNMRDHGHKPEWVNLAKLRLQRAEAELSKGSSEAEGE